ncbi:hypothetical protein JCM8097_002026 [Rhodosporidiobolus ruineniae]
MSSPSTSTGVARGGGSKASESRAHEDVDEAYSAKEGAGSSGSIHTANKQKSPLATLDINPHWQSPSLDFDPATLPLLPPILDPNLARQACLHRSAVGQEQGESNKDYVPRQNLASYERLELVGDAALRLAVVEGLHQRYPNLLVSGLSSMSQELLDNRMLSFISVAFGLDHGLTSTVGVPTRELTNQKAVADLFEAHIGALHLDPSVPSPSSFIQALFSPIVFPGLDGKASAHEAKARRSRAEEARVAEDDSRPTKRPGTSVAKAVCSACDTPVKKRITYEYDRGDPQRGWHAYFCVDGERVACGSGPKKAMAERAAAERAASGLLR